MYATHCCLLLSVWLSHSVLSRQIQNGGVSFIKTIFSDWSNKFRYRKYDLDQYREAISSKVTESIEKFRRDQLVAQSVAQKDLESYMDKFNQLYASNLAALEKRKEAVKDMRKKMEIKRPPKIDDSLEQFRQFYNESVTLGPYESVTKHLKFNFIDKANNDESKKTRKRNILIRSKKPIRVASLIVPTKKALSMEKVMRTAALDLIKIQEDLTSNAKLLALSTQKSIMTTIDKKNIRRETRNLEAQLKKLNKEGAIL